MADGRTLLHRPKPADAPKRWWGQVIRVEDHSVHEETIVAGNLVTASGDSSFASGGDVNRSAMSTGSGTAIVAHIVNIYRAAARETRTTTGPRWIATWLGLRRTGQVVLRGIKRGGQQAVELPLDEVYVPLAAEALPDAREELKRQMRTGSAVGRARNCSPDHLCASCWPKASTWQ